MRSPPLLDEGLCTFEVDRAKAFGGVSRVRILDEILREPTLAAMARWNDAAGETLFEEYLAEVDILGTSRRYVE